MAKSEMSQRERLLCAMRCETPDRVPIQVRGVYPTIPGALENCKSGLRPVYEAVLNRCDPVEYHPMASTWYGVPGSAIDHRVETVALDEEWVEDIVTVQTPRGQLTESFRRSLKGKPGFKSTHAVHNEEDAEKFLSLPTDVPALDVKGFNDAVKRVGDRALVIAAIGSNPLAMVHHLIESEQLAIWSLTERDLVNRLLANVKSRWEAIIDGLLEAGVGPVFSTLGHELCLPPLLSPADFREFIVANETAGMQMIHDRDCLVHVHCHYNLSKVLDGFIELGVNCLHPVEAPPMGDIELVEAKKRLAGVTCIEGNIQIGDFQMKTSDEIRRSTEQIISDAADGGGLILCPTASPFWSEISDRIVENYLAFIETGRELGSYSL